MNFDHFNGFQDFIFLLQKLFLGLERFKYEKNENKWKIMEKSFFSSLPRPI
jgi:hypothetical protein